MFVMSKGLWVVISIAILITIAIILSGSVGQITENTTNFFNESL